MSNQSIYSSNFYLSVKGTRKKGFFKWGVNTFIYEYKIYHQTNKRTAAGYLAKGCER